MKVLFLNHNVAFKGGTFFRAYHFARHLVQMGHEVTLYAISPKARFTSTIREMEGVRLIESPDWLSGIGRSGWDIWDTVTRLFSVAKEDWDLVHAFDSRPVVVFPALFVQRRCGAKMFMDWADWWGRGGTLAERKSKLLRCGFGPVETFFEEHFRSRADKTTAISHALAKRAESLGIPQEKIFLLPNGSDVNGIQVLDRTKSREELGIETNAILLGYLGTAHHADGALLLDAFAEILKRDGRARLLLIGNSAVQFREHPAADRVIATGFIGASTMNKYLAACDLMLLPMRDTIANRGRWPSKINDYMAAGRATVAMPVGELDALFGQSEIGQLAGGSAVSVAQAALDLLDDPCRRERCERNARQAAEQVFAWPILTRCLEGMYRASLNRKFSRDGAVRENSLNTPYSPQP
jgi:glycosyltransferase involved in cell wall biosynthesis